MEIFLIAAVDKNLAIGKDGKIPWHIKEDLQYFQKNTLNTAMIMGRSTFDSIGKALPNRQNIVMTKSPTNREGVIEVLDAASAIKEAKKAINEGANYVSFGAFSQSSTKKEAIPIEKSDLDLINKFNVSNKAIIGGISNENFHEVAELNFDMIALSNAIFNSQDTAKSASFFVNNFNFE